MFDMMKMQGVYFDTLQLYFETEKLHFSEKGKNVVQCFKYNVPVISYSGRSLMGLQLSNIHRDI